MEKETKQLIEEIIRTLDDMITWKTRAYEKMKRTADNEGERAFRLVQIHKLKDKKTNLELILSGISA